MCSIKVKRFELVELSIPASSLGKINFQSIPQLRNQANQEIVIKNIFCFTDATYGHSQQSPSIPGLPVADLKKAALVLYINGEESTRLIPLAFLVQQDDQTNPYQPEIVSFDELTNVDFDKSYVQFNEASDDSPYIIPFGINYIRFMKNPSNPNGNFIEA